MTASTKIFIPRDTASISMGGDEVAKKIEKIAQKQKKEVTIIRNGTWGMSWLEPLIEIEVKNHRIAYGPVSEEDVIDLFNADFLNDF